MFVRVDVRFEWELLEFSFLKRFRGFVVFLLRPFVDVVMELFISSLDSESASFVFFKKLKSRFFDLGHQIAWFYRGCSICRMALSKLPGKSIYA